MSGIQKKKNKNFGFLTFDTEDDLLEFKKVFESKKIMIKKRAVTLKETDKDRQFQCKKFKSIEEEVDNNRNNNKELVIKEEDIEKIKSIKIWE